MGDRLTLQEQAAKYQAMVAKRTEAQRRRRAKKRAEGMREVTAWVRDMPEDKREEWVPVLVWVSKARLADYQAKQAIAEIPYLRGDPAVLTWGK